MTVTVTREAWELLLAGVPALTLRNPWAHYVAHHGKNIENRTWAPPVALRWLLIHAGTAWDRVPHPMRPAGPMTAPHTSAIVALTEVVGVCEPTTMRHRRCRCGPWAMPGDGIYHWQLGTVIALPTPVPTRGWLKLWHPQPPLVTDVAGQLALADLNPGKVQ